MQRQLPRTYAQKELADEIARLDAVLYHCQARFEGMSDLAEAVEHAKNDRKRLKRTARLVELAKQGARLTRVPVYAWLIDPEQGEA